MAFASGPTNPGPTTNLVEKTVKIQVRCGRHIRWPRTLLSRTDSGVPSATSCGVALCLSRTSFLLGVSVDRIVEGDDPEEVRQTRHVILERRSPSIRRGSSTRDGDRKILHDEPIVDTADGVCDIVRGSAVEGVLLVGGDGVRRTQRTSK